MSFRIAPTFEISGENLVNSRLHFDEYAVVGWQARSIAESLGSKHRCLLSSQGDGTDERGQPPLRPVECATEVRELSSHSTSLVSADLRELGARWPGVDDVVDVGKGLPVPQQDQASGHGVSTAYSSSSMECLGPRRLSTHWAASFHSSSVSR